MKRHFSFFRRTDNSSAHAWERKIRTTLSRHGVSVIKTPRSPHDVLIVLGGDGTILEAVRTHHTNTPLILGLNLGSVGFLASVRSSRQFLSAIRRVLKNSFHTVERTMIQATLIRARRTLHTLYALNEILVQNPLGMVHLDVSVSGHKLQTIHGTGALVATPTGSTAYNISAHGPIVMPDIDSLILTEILDHGIPTPSIVTRGDASIAFKVREFREHNRLALYPNGTPFDVLLSADGENMVPLRKNDRIVVTRVPCPVRFIEFEKNYFLSSLQEKFRLS